MKVDATYMSGYKEPIPVGPVAQFAPAVPTIPTLDVSGGAAPSFTSPLYKSGGFKALSVGATLTRAGTLVVNRYVDEAGLVLLDSASVNLTANTAGSNSINDGKSFGSFQFVLANTDATGGHTAVASNVAIMQSAN